MVIGSISSATKAANRHVDKAGNTAKYWLNPVALAQNIGFAARQLAEIEAKIAAQQARFLEAWNEHFNDR